MNRDFEDFLKTDTVVPSEHVHRRLQQVVLEEAPRTTTTAMKLAGTHLAASIITLTACPQFGLRLFYDGHGLMHYFMDLGDAACWFLCGFFYLSVTALMARFVLQPGDWGLLRQRRMLWMPSLIALTMGALIMMSGEFSVQYGLMWALGSGAALWLFSPGPLHFAVSSNSTIKG